MQIKSIAECSKGSILLYFRPSLSYQLLYKIFVLIIFEWPFYTGFTVLYMYVYFLFVLFPPPSYSPHPTHTNDAIDWFYDCDVSWSYSFVV